jgi:hypothetical protein
MKNSISNIGAVLILAFFSFTALAQEDIGYRMKGNSREIEANFLSNYYQQNGNNGAVTGGVGTEELTNFANIFTLNIPLDSVNAISLYGGADYYSSASTDNIDNQMSSASSSDLRAFGTVSYARKNLNRNETYGIRAGLSQEYDYSSFSFGLSYTKEWNNGNSEINALGQAFIDQWTLIYPIELRGGVSLPTKNRQSFNGQINFSQVINKRLQMNVSGEFVYMQGLLSTPFHRVYFSDITVPDIERLPGNRLKLPIGVRLNYFPLDYLVVRGYYRYYWDDFGIRAHTADLELPFKLNKAITIAPFFRYHVQTSAAYFSPFQQHLSTEEFYTSDFDLSALNSQKFGLNIRYSPLYGLARTKPVLPGKWVFMVKYLEARFGYYTRNTGLSAYFVSLNLGFSAK